METGCCQVAIYWWEEVTCCNEEAWRNFNGLKGGILMSSFNHLFSIVSACFMLNLFDESWWCATLISSQYISKSSSSRKYVLVTLWILFLVDVNYKNICPIKVQFGWNEVGKKKLNKIVSCILSVWSLFIWGVHELKSFWTDNQALNFKAFWFLGKLNSWPNCWAICFECSSVLISYLVYAGGRARSEQCDVWFALCTSCSSFGFANYPIL